MQAGVELTAATSTWQKEIANHSTKVSIIRTEEVIDDTTPPPIHFVDMVALKEEINESAEKLLSKVWNYSLISSKIQRHSSAQRRWDILEKPRKFAWEAAVNLQGDHISPC